MLSAWSIEMMIQMLSLQQDDSLLVYIDDHFREFFWGNGWEPCDGICTFEYMQVGQIYQKFQRSIRQWDCAECCTLEHRELAGGKTFMGLYLVCVS
jgi:hypothetical protein